MRKSRQEKLVIGELAAFAVTWMLAIVAALNDYQGRVNSAARDNVAAGSSITEPLSTFE
jgi:hypothetical protein